jgi:hypothetical protein
VGAGEAQNPEGPHQVPEAHDVDCLRRKQVDINRRMLIQPQAFKGSKGLV